MELGTIEEVELIVDQIASNKIPPPNKAQSLVIIRQMMRMAQVIENQTANIASKEEEIEEKDKLIRELKYELEGTQDMAQFYSFLRERPDWIDWDIAPVPEMPKEWKGHDDFGMKLDAAINLVMGREIEALK